MNFDSAELELIYSLVDEEARFRAAHNECDCICLDILEKLEEGEPSLLLKL